MVVNLLHCKISFYLWGYLFSFRKKHVENQGGLGNVVSPRSQQHAKIILFQAYRGWIWLTDTYRPAKERGNLWGVPVKPTEHPLVEAPPLLCSFPTTAAPSLLTESWKVLPSSRASPAGKNQHWSHSQSHQGAEIRSKQWETVKL